MPRKTTREDRVYCVRLNSEDAEPLHAIFRIIGNDSPTEAFRWIMQLPELQNFINAKDPLAMLATIAAGE